MVAVVDKSAQFLDTFWKLARDKNIPDRWLIRRHDLDRLEEAMREQNLEVRLRVLKRMEPFMQCYPPYCYYVARTQQALGQLSAAADTYGRLVELGTGHFRKDDMLAAGLANRAAILEYLQQPSAVETAAEALQYSTEVWEVNLLCARVLQRHGRIEAAEDAILRNLDVDLERKQSRISLLALYYHAKNTKKLSAQLGNVEVVRSVPVPVLLRCAGLLGAAKLPEPVISHLTSSLYGVFDLHFGLDDFVFRATPAWQMQTARITMKSGDQDHRLPRRLISKGYFEGRFPRILELGNPLKPVTDVRSVTLVLKYPETSEIRIHLRRQSVFVLTGTPANRTETKNNPRWLLPGHRFRIAAIQVGNTNLTFVDRPE